MTYRFGESRMTCLICLASLAADAPLIEFAGEADRSEAAVRRSIQEQEKAALRPLPAFFTASQVNFFNSGRIMFAP
jgi:hypothetical protein